MNPAVYDGRRRNGQKECLLSLVLSSALASIPTQAFGLTLETIAITDYAANGTANSNLANPINAAVNVGSAFQAKGHTWLYHDTNTAAKAWLFTGTWPGIANRDVVYFNGHGAESGPVLGSYPAYVGMNPSNYYWGSAGVRWFISDSCSNLYDGNTQNVGPNWSSISRWWQAINWGAGSVHSFFAFRSFAWDVTDAGKNFVDRALGNGQAAGQAWFDGVANAEWDAPWWAPWYHPTQGVEPAVLSCQADGKDYFYENMNAPYINPANATNKYQVTYHWAYYGTPKFF